MITRVEIKNYRSIAHADVKLGPLTVLVGRNGSGKSSFVEPRVGFGELSALVSTLPNSRLSNDHQIQELRRH